MPSPVLRSVNPATGEEIERFEEFTAKRVGVSVEQARSAFRNWRQTSFADRADRMRALGGVLRRRKRAYAETMAREMGKPVLDGVREVEKSAWACDFYADHASEFLSDEVVKTDAKRSFVRYEPLGPILAVMPWNFPFWQVFRFAAPTLMAGNVALLKHASNVTRCALEIQEAFTEAGFPPGVFQTLVIGSRLVPAIVRDPRVRGVSLTGSEGAGVSVAVAAGAVVKKSVLELGGSDPFIVLADADVENAARAAAEARLRNAGQSCIAAKRFVVEAPVYEEFVEQLAVRMGGLRMGDPLAEATEIGPLARRDLRGDLHRQVTESVLKGAKIRLGGKPSKGPGFFYPATVLARVRSRMPVYREEVFGPVAAVIRAADERDAIRIANDTKFGLGASIWTQDVKRGLRLAGVIEAGMVSVNRRVQSDPRLPFGGVKASGYGRELGSQGIREFVNAKAIVVGA